MVAAVAVAAAGAGRSGHSAPRSELVGKGRNDRVYAVVRRIPAGRVATYGQVAALVGMHGHARQVGYALHALPSHSTVPWHRVVNARGEVSARVVPGAEVEQRQLLEGEGVHFDARGRIALERALWRPRRGPGR
jgi:methylated-DNA-protein-cysteine methyltransferase-like protein